MDSWKEIEIRSGLTTIIDYRGKTPPKSEDGIPLISAANIKSGALDFSKPSFISLPDYKKWTRRGFTQPGDVLITTEAPAGEVALLPGDKVYQISRRVMALRTDEKTLHNKFLFFVLQHQSVKGRLLAASRGSTVPRVLKTDITQLKIRVPSYDEQKSITAVLASLDDKIDLLHRQNKTLEALAQTLFRHWFIDGAEDDWDVVTVGDFAQINASTVQRDYEHELIEYLDTGSITEGKVSGFQQYTLEDAPSRAKRLVKHNDIVYSTVRPNQKHYGIIKNPQLNLVVSTGFCVITCDRIDPHFVYILLTQPDMTEYLHSIAEGSTSAYPSLKPSDIASLEFQLPPKKRLDEFSTIAQSCWGKIDRNSSQIRTLEKLRDTLLPKLMSGEVRVRLS